MKESSENSARQFYVAAIIADQENLTADEDLLEDLKTEFLLNYKLTGDAGEDFLANEGKAEFQGYLEVILVQRYFAENNTFKLPQQ